MTPEQYDARAEELLNRVRQRAAQISASDREVTAALSRINTILIGQIGNARIPPLSNFDELDQYLRARSETRDKAIDRVVAALEPEFADGGLA